jgi:ubiquinone/menaquinone biosynthesis C-methylase UbiE
MKRDLIDYQSHYANQPYEKYQVYFRKTKLKEIMKSVTHNNLLEVGCGLESIFLDIDDFDKITVIEPSDLFYEKALVDRKSKKDKDIHIIKGYLEESISELKNNLYDFILVSSLLHEIPNVDLFLNSIYSLANKDTIIHVNVPNADSFHRVLALEMGLIKSQFEKSENNIEFQQNTVFDIKLLKDTFINAGFEVIDEGSYSVKPFTHLQMQNLIDGGYIDLDILWGLYKMEKYMPGLGSEIYINVKIK